MTIQPALLDQLLEHDEKPEDLLGENGILKQLTKALLERTLQAELTHHLGHDHGQTVQNGNGNHRNGKGKKKVKGEFGTLEIDVPRDRHASFEPKILPKGQSRFTGFDDKIISLYARGMSDRDIQAHLEEMYGVEISPGLISDVTDAVLEEVKAWQARTLDAIYPILYLDALFVKIRDNGVIQTKAVYTAIGVNLEGQKEVLGLWVAESEGAKFWLSILTELKNRGVQDTFIVCVDGLKGFPEAVEAVFPQAQVQLCIVHLVRYSLNFVSWKERKAVVSNLKAIYRASTEVEAERALEVFCATWDSRYPMISQTWRRNWARVVAFFAFPPEIRKAIYTTNSIESLHSQLRKVTKTRGSFPTEQAALKLLFLVIQNATKKWTMPIQDWRAALNRFLIMFQGRLPF